MTDPTTPYIPALSTDIRQHGATLERPDLCTSSIAAAIAWCDEQGGGRVNIPPGTWHTGPIHMRSHIDLHLEAGAELRFSQDPQVYLPVVYQSRGGIRCFNYSPFIYAQGCHDIAITGSGVLEGQGATWWPWKLNQPGMVDLFAANAERRAVEERVYGTPEAGVRPPFFQAIDCQNVLIQGVTFQNSPAWTVHPVWCENVTIRGITIRSPSNAYNTDGIDPDGCRRVLVEDCLVDTGDDGICLKSGREPDAWEAGRPCEDIVIRRCRVLSAHGGVVIGSEMAAGVRNVVVQDCEFDGTKVGIRIKTRAGRGGYIENISVERVRMRNIRNEAISVTMRYNGEALDGRVKEVTNVPRVGNIALRDIVCESAGASISLQGLEGHPIHSMVLENIRIGSNTPMLQENVEALEMRDVRIAPLANQ